MAKTEYDFLTVAVVGLLLTLSSTAQNIVVWRQIFSMASHVFIICERTTTKHELFNTLNSLVMSF